MHRLKDTRIELVKQVSDYGHSHSLTQHLRKKVFSETHSSSSSSQDQCTRPAGNDRYIEGRKFGSAASSLLQVKSVSVDSQLTNTYIHGLRG